MVISISNSIQNYNNCSYGKIKKIPNYKIGYCPASINFKGSIHSLQKPKIFASAFALLGGIASFIGINKNTEFEKYFEQIGKIQTYAYKNDKKILNPELVPYLNRLDNFNKKQQKQFVKAFCKKTGFPNLNKVQHIMNEEIKRAIYASMKDTNVNPIFAAYSSCCSLGKAFAIPGSDCDGLFIVTDTPLPPMIGRWTIGNEINQRLVDTQGEHYPELFSIYELMPYIELSNEIFERIKTPQKIKNYKNNLTRSDQDFLKAGEFNLDIASNIQSDYTKNMMYLTGMFAEELRAGHILINNIDKGTLDKIQNSALYKYSNVVRQEGFKDNVKPKWENRRKIASEFNSMSDDEKFDICSEMLKASMGIHKSTPSNCYENFDMGNILDLVDKITSFRK